VSLPPLNSELVTLISALPQASSLDLYRIEFAIERLRNDPQRILAIRQRLHLGMVVRFFGWQDGAMHTGRIVVMRDRDVTIDDTTKRSRWSGVPYAALYPDDGSEDSDVEVLDETPPPLRTPKRFTREDFAVGSTVSFVDRYEQTRIGRITRMNVKTATVECDNGAWRVSFGLLQHVVDL
jgi:hypothetical protein